MFSGELGVLRFFFFFQIAPLSSLWNSGSASLSLVSSSWVCKEGVACRENLHGANLLQDHLWLPWIKIAVCKESQPRQLMCAGSGEGSLCSHCADTGQWQPRLSTDRSHSWGPCPSLSVDTAVPRPLLVMLEQPVTSQSTGIEAMANVDGSPRLLLGQDPSSGQSQLGRRPVT